jgi:ubiquinone/menaquinone biosynthesis C-methylase UbiE
MESVMSEPALQAQMETARAYESLFVPAVFGEWAPRVADAAQIRSGQRVLDVACGTGVLAREAAARTGPSGSVSGLDPGVGMLAVARHLAPDIDWLQGVAESLPFPDRSFDAVISQFGLMFFADRRQALREMLRVLTPEGRVAVAVWDSLEQNPAYETSVEMLERLAGRPASDALRAPFVLGNEQDLRAMFTDAGVASVEIASGEGMARFPNIRTMVEADLRGWLPVMGVLLPEEQIDRILTEAETVLRPYAASDGTMVFRTRAHLVVGRRP